MPVRTPPLIIDKETGEPKNITPWQARPETKPWRVVLVTPDGKRVGRLFKRYKSASKFAKKMRKKYPKIDGFEVTIVSRSVGYGPPFTRLPDEELWKMNERGIFWCPYCRKPRKFIWFANKWQDCCPVCEIPIFDFHVTKNNPHFWGEREE